MNTVQPKTKKEQLQDLIKDSSFIPSAIDNPFGREAGIIRETAFEDASKKPGFIKVLQSELRQIVEASHLEIQGETALYASAIGIVHTLIENHRLEELNTVLAIGFPEFYSLPEEMKDGCIERLGLLKQNIESGTIINQLFQTKEDRK